MAKKIFNPYTGKVTESKQLTKQQVKEQGERVCVQPFKTLRGMAEREIWVSNGIAFANYIGEDGRSYSWTCLGKVSKARRYYGF